MLKVKPDKTQANQINLKSQICPLPPRPLCLLHIITSVFLQSKKVICVSYP